MSHALFSPSSAARWMACPGSVALAKDLPDESSDFADEGTAAHELAALCLLGGSDAAEHVSRQITVNGKAYTVDAEMASHVQVYLDTVRGLADLGDELRIEQRLPIGHITGEEGAHGTADALVLVGDELVIIDLKYGRGVEVDAERNAQLQIYALGALHEFDLVYAPTQVRLIICQPRRHHVSEWTCSVEDLCEFGKAVTLKANRARACIEQGDVDPGDDLHPTEHGCRFCRAKATCLALRQRVLDTLTDDFVDCSLPLAPQLAGAQERIEHSDAAQLAECLALCDLVEGWCKAVRARAESELLAGRDVPGFKLVEGRKGARRWTDTDEAEVLLKAMGLKHSLIYDYSVISPTTAERLAKAGEIGPRQWPKLSACITQPDGKPSVAPASDKRPAIAPRASEDDFDNVSQADPAALA